MHPLEIREERFRLQQQLGKLADDDDKSELEGRLAAIQEACPHVNGESNEEQGWRCRDCDLMRPPEPQPETGDEDAGSGDDAASSDADDGPASEAESA